MEIPNFYNPKFKTYHKKYFDSILKKLNLKFVDYCAVTGIPYSTIQNARATGRVDAYYILVLHNALTLSYVNELHKKITTLNQIFEIENDT